MTQYNFTMATKEIICAENKHGQKEISFSNPIQAFKMFLILTKVNMKTMKMFCWGFFVFSSEQKDGDEEAEAASSVS